ncbi:hypothetical protein OAV85_00615 [Candidatus Nanopelagicales bacterium]|nr:hypothetical protein [Candidatus Nanopelagicales bacterium]
MRLLRLLQILAVALIALFSIRLAWLGDDALITLRTALNVTHGWGLGFNATEAVQAYTHPLWFLLWTALGSLTGQWAFGILAMGVAFTALAAALLVLRISEIPALVALTSLLLFSNAFMEYSTSGLENSLAYALAGILITLTAIRSEQDHPSWWAPTLGLAAAGLFLTRMDLIVVLLPVLLVIIWESRRRLKVIGAGLLAFALPTVFWLLWTYLNYGTALPNTFAAKRNVNIPLGELTFQGFRYLWVGFENDPVTLLAIVLGISVGLSLGTVIVRAWALGVLFYLAYILWIGGDYMGGRFLAVPVYISVFLIALVVNFASRDKQQAPVFSGRSAAAIAASIAVLVSLTGMGQTPVALANPQLARWDYGTSAGIADERGLSVERGRSLRSALIEGQPNIPSFKDLGDPTSAELTLFSIHGLAKSWPNPESAEGTPARVAAICSLLPVVALSTGPRTHLIDTCGLTDRFVATIPFTPPASLAWRSGHLERELPLGYVEAVETGDPTRVLDPELAARLDSIWTEIRNSQ